MDLSIEVGVPGANRPISRELSATASPAVFAGDVLYFSGFSGFTPGYGYVSGTLEHQVRFAHVLRVLGRRSRFERCGGIHGFERFLGIRGDRQQRRARDEDRRDPRANRAWG